MPRRFSALLAAALLLAPLQAFAHAILMSSAPGAGAAVAPGVVAVELRFNSRIDRGRSRLTLVRPDHTHLPLPIAPDGPPDILRTSAELTPGAYAIRWQVLAVDGHITRGEVSFTVSPKP